MSGRFAAWLVTGPVGRVLAFAGDLGAALARAVLHRVRRDPTGSNVPE